MRMNTRMKSRNLVTFSFWLGKGLRWRQPAWMWTKCFYSINQRQVECFPRTIWFLQAQKNVDTLEKGPWGIPSPSFCTQWNSCVLCGQISSDGMLTSPTVSLLLGWTHDQHWQSWSPRECATPWEPSHRMERSRSQMQARDWVTRTRRAKCLSIL
jgi:hypothetical protein